MPAGRLKLRDFKAVRCGAWPLSADNQLMTGVKIYKVLDLGQIKGRDFQGGAFYDETSNGREPVLSA